MVSEGPRALLNPVALLPLGADSSPNGKLLAAALGSVGANSGCFIRAAVFAAVLTGCISKGSSGAVDIASNKSRLGFLKMAFFQILFTYHRVSGLKCTTQWLLVTWWSCGD